MYNIVHSYIPFFVHSYFIINNERIKNNKVQENESLKRRFCEEDKGFW